MREKERENNGGFLKLLTFFFFFFSLNRFKSSTYHLLCVMVFPFAELFVFLKFLLFSFCFLQYNRKLKKRSQDGKATQIGETKPP